MENRAFMSLIMTRGQSLGLSIAILDTVISLSNRVAYDFSDPANQKDWKTQHVFNTSSKATTMRGAAYGKS